MIIEEIIKCETAQMLKNIGCEEAGYFIINDKGNVDCLYPITQSQALRWLRDNISVIVTTRYSWDNAWWYTFESQKHQFYKSYDFDKNGHFLNYETATEAGIQAACEYILKNIKNR